MNLREQFSKVRVMVLGDVILDQYWWGTVERISPEAPVPVVRLNRETVVPGGAANVAVNIAGLGATPVVVGCVGTDAGAGLLRANLRTAGINDTRLIGVDGRPTPLKTRVVAHSQHVVRVDHESIEPIAPATEQQLIDHVLGSLDDVDLLIVSDYAKGTLTSNVISSVIKAARSKKIPVLVDPKGKNYAKFQGATILTPNRREAADACSLDERLDDVVAIASRRLLDELDLNAILITEGDRGMTLLERGMSLKSFHAEAHEIYDVTGAGDTVIATLGVGVAAGLPLVEAVKISNTAASLVVEQVGTTAITIDRLETKLAT